MLRGVEIGEDPAKPENIVGAFAGGDKFCFVDRTYHISHFHRAKQMVLTNLLLCH